jgi:hypothetical protein
MSLARTRRVDVEEEGGTKGVPLTKRDVRFTGNGAWA